MHTVGKKTPLSITSDKTMGSLTGVKGNCPKLFPENTFLLKYPEFGLIFRFFLESHGLLIQTTIKPTFGSDISVNKRN